MTDNDDLVVIDDKWCWW